MKFSLVFTKEAEIQLKKLKNDRGKAKQYKAVVKSLKLLKENPRHPSLQSHKYRTLKGPDGEDIFEAYAQQNTPSTYRIFFCYSKKKEQIVVISIIPHP